MHFPSHSSHDMHLKESLHYFIRIYSCVHKSIDREYMKQDTHNLNRETAYVNRSEQHTQHENSGNQNKRSTYINTYILRGGGNAAQQKRYPTAAAASVPTASAGPVTAAPELGPPGPGAAAGAEDAVATATSDNATAAAARILSLRVAAISLAASLSLSAGARSRNGVGTRGELACVGMGEGGGAPGYI